MSKRKENTKSEKKEVFKKRRKLKKSPGVIVTMAYQIHLNSLDCIKTIYGGVSKENAIN